ncbi:hypothetical protein MMC31_006968 [Peltigera leucophlebia]|nr:hypothetical protein [Peltigera leucophlebia]
MERVASGSNLPRPSAISRLPRPGISNIQDKPQTAHAPNRYSLSIPRTRPSTRPAGAKALTSQAVEEGQEIDDIVSPPEPIDGKAQEPSLQPIKIENGRKEKDTGDLPGKPSIVPRRVSRLTLVDRTVETLSHIPPSPSPRRRKSNFFPTELPTSSLSRPGSSLSRSRPSTSTGMYPPPPPNFSTPRGPSPMKHQSETIIDSPSVKPLQNRRSVSSFVPRGAPRSQARPLAPVHTTPSKPPVPKLSDEMVYKWSNRQEERVVKNSANLFSGQSIPNSTKGSLANHSAKSKTYAPRTTKQRPSAINAFSRSPPAQATDDIKRRVSAAPRKMIRTLPAKSTEVSSTSSTRTVSSPVLGVTNSPATSDSPKPSPKSSATLRETIAKAKAARRNALKSNGNHSQSLADRNNHELQSDFVGDAGFFGDVAEAAKVLRKRIEIARTTGKLNISAIGLKKLPKEINEMYNLDSIESDQGEWYESVDLVRLVAADNELDILDEWAFPDFAAEAAQGLDDDFGGSIFRGLETLDLHGNRLSALPEGLRRLERLATLNLSKNRLGNESLDLLCQMSSLRELRLNENRLEGILPDSFRNLKSLEVLELRDNALTSVTTVLEDLTSIRVLVIAGNKLTSVPFELLQSLPLLELDAARNRLDGILIPQGVKGFPNLKSLDVSHNALTWILEDEGTKLPSLQVLNVSENRLVDLPKLSDWPELITLSAGNNKITSLSEGLTSLQKLCNLDLACNNLKSLDSEIGLMESLISLRVANNPLRERRFLTMATEDIKNELRNRIIPPESHEASDPHEIPSRNSSPEHPSRKTWPITGGGILDRSSTNLETITTSDLEPILNTTPIKSLLLHHNALTEIPPTIALLENTLITLDLGHNRLSASQSFISITSPLPLPHLTTLSLASNALPNLTPLLTSLWAPNLQTLNIANNRISSLPLLREVFPCLSGILAADNCIEDIEVDNVRGLRVLDLTGNEISHLKPELGLLEAEGLKEFLVAGNRFRVPRREVVERGTGAVMAWLRSKVVES